MEKDRSTDGQFTPEHTDAEILAAVRTHEPAATSEVAGEVGMSRQGADRRLRRLRDGGRVNSKKIAAARVWFTGTPPEPTDRPAPDDWADKRREVLSRDGFTCQECGADVSKTGSEIHHKTPLAAGGDNSLSNLETLCPNCHGEKHQGEPLAAVLDVFNQVRSPAIVSADVADALDVTRETARRKLTDLYERGDLNRRKTAGIVVYWRAGTDALLADAESARESAVTGSEAEAGRTDAPATTTATRGQDGAENGGCAEGILRDLNLPGSGGQLDARIDALATIHDHLHANAGDAVGKGELLDLVDADAVGYKDAGSFWTNCVKANKGQGRETNALVALPGVEHWGGGQYRWVGDGEGEDA